MATRIDILIMGASGFTGKQVIPHVHKFTKTEGRHLSWAVAGRSEKKLKEAIAKIGDVPIIIADVTNEVSLRRMAGRARVVINCCGPYHVCGEALVKACLEAGAHYVDASWEGEFIGDVCLKYHQEAVNKGIYMISSCGFDSIPSDMGMVFLQNNFAGTLNSVEMYLQTNIGIFRPARPIINDGTWKSLVYNFTHAKEAKLIQIQSSEFLPQLKPKPLVHKSRILDSWAVPFFGPDRTVILKTQRFFHEHSKKRPIQYYSYLAVGSLINLIAVALIAGLFVLFAKFKCGQNLLLRYPKIFTCGVIAQGGPSEETQNKTCFAFVLCGQGWKQKLTENCKTPIDSTMVVEVKGVNGYRLTGLALALSAIVVIAETERLPNRGGVYTPGAAFAKTSLIEQLSRNGLSFEITSRS